MSFTFENTLDTESGIYPEITYQELIREHISPEFAEYSDGDIEEMLGEALAGMSPEEVENFFRSLGRIARSAGRTLVRAAPAILPVAGGALGTIFGGPVGTAIGSQLGNIAGGLVGRAVAPRRRRTGRRGQRRITPGRRSAVPSRGSSATAQLMNLLNNPDLLRSLLSRVMGNRGRVEVLAGGEGIDVDFPSFMNALAELAAEAASEAHEEGVADSGLPEYLVDEAGEALDDVRLPEVRAEILMELLNASEAEERTEGNQWSAEPVENWLMEAGLMEVGS